MLKELELLVNKIEDAEKDLTNITTRINEIDSRRINEVIVIAQKGVKFEKIYTSNNVQNANGFNYRNDITEYFKNDDGNFLKGIKVASKETYTNKYGTGAEYNYIELFLLSTGELKVFYNEDNVDYFQGGNSQYERIFSRKHTIEEFDTEEIISGIMEALNDRLKDLGTRTKTQQERLEKIEKLQVV